MISEDKMAKHKIKCMKDLDLFAALDESEKQVVKSLSRPIFYKKGQNIFPKEHHVIRYTLSVR